MRFPKLLLTLLVAAFSFSIDGCLTCTGTGGDADACDIVVGSGFQSFGVQSYGVQTFAVPTFVQAAPVCQSSFAYGGLSVQSSFNSFNSFAVPSVVVLDVDRRFRVRNFHRRGVLPRVGAFLFGR